MFDCNSGERVGEHQFPEHNLGYLVVGNGLIISGGWRGYTDLTAYDLKSFQKRWIIPTRTKKHNGFSVPRFFDKNQLVVSNYSTQSITVIETETGSVRAELPMPDGICCPDLGSSFKMVDGKPTFFSNEGSLYILNTEATSLTRERLKTPSCRLGIPFFCHDKMVFRDQDGNSVLYNRTSENTLWRHPFEHDLQETFAVMLGDETCLLAGSRGMLKLVCRGENMPLTLDREARISTPLYVSGNVVVFGTKGKIKALNFRGWP